MVNDLHFSPKNWMARNYWRYVELGGRPRDPENLCRFLRVALIYAPLRRYFKGTTRFDGSPFAVTILCTLLISVGVLLVRLAKYFLFDDWMSGLWTAWTCWMVLVFVQLGIWGESGRLRELRNALIEPLHAMESYRHARRGRFCPLITIEREKTD